MKLLAAVLFLLPVLGANASPLGEEPSPRLDQVADTIKQYLEQLLSTLAELIQKSELAQEIEAWRLTGKTSNFFDELDRKVPPKVKEQLRNLSRPVEESLSELWKLERKMQPYETQLHAVLVSYTEGPLEMVEHYSKTLLGSKVYSIIPSRVKLQEQLGFYAQELGLQEFEHGLAAYARDLHQKLSPYAEDLHGWLNSRWDALMQCFSEEISGGAS